MRAELPKPAMRAAAKAAKAKSNPRHKAAIARLQRGVTVFISAYYPSEYGDGPEYARLYADVELANRLLECQALCVDRNLNMVELEGDIPPPEDDVDLEVKVDSWRLRIYSTTFCLHGPPAEPTDPCATESDDVDIGDFFAALGCAPDAIMPEGFRWFGGSLLICGAFNDAIDAFVDTISERFPELAAAEAELLMAATIKKAGDEGGVTCSRKAAHVRRAEALIREPVRARRHSRLL